jgi:hypothetical protein
MRDSSKRKSDGRVSKHLPKRTTVFVVGAGFSRDLGYPLTSELLKQLQMSAPLWAVFRKVVKFHHPDWNGRKNTLPDIETLLTEWAANQDLLPSLRPIGEFSADDLKRLRRNLLGEIADWFHGIHKKPFRGRESALRRFVQLISSVENPVVVSFNWDYELDRVLCEGRQRREVYGITANLLRTPVILKPHGSLNWYRFNPGKHIKEARRETLWEDSKKKQNARYCFLNWRAPKSSRRRYIPWIVPPTHVKSFDHSMLRRIWRTSVDCLSVAKRIYFLGYSLPAADWHSRYIFRCGFHNQVEGRPLDKGGREKSTGRAAVFVVNPKDKKAYKRIQTTAGYDCVWIRSKVKEWLRKSV